MYRALFSFLYYLLVLYAAMSYRLRILPNKSLEDLSIIIILIICRTMPVITHPIICVRIHPVRLTTFGTFKYFWARIAVLAHTRYRMLIPFNVNIQTVINHHIFLSTFQAIRSSPFTILWLYVTEITQFLVYRIGFFEAYRTSAYFISSFFGELFNCTNISLIIVTILS